MMVMHCLAASSFLVVATSMQFKVFDHCMMSDIVFSRSAPACINVALFRQSFVVRLSALLSLPFDPRKRFTPMPLKLRWELTPSMD